MVKHPMLIATLFASLGMFANDATGQNVRALVVLDYIGEPLVLSAEKDVNIPGDNHAVLLLHDDGSTTLRAWKNSNAEVKFIAAEDVLVENNAGDTIVAEYPASSAMITEKLNDQDWLPVSWKMPYVADFRVVYRKNTGVLPPENGRQESWKIMPFRNAGMLADTSVAIYNGENWSNWISGYGGTFYPARADKNGLYLRFLHAGEFPHQNHDAEFGAYIYPDSAATHPQYWQEMDIDAVMERPEMPRQVIEKFLGSELWKSMCELENEGKWFPATCGITEDIEKIFYRSESYAKRSEISERIGNMDKFVRRIRERIESFRAWGNAEKAWLQANAPESISKAFEADLSAFDAYYNQYIERMKQPADCEKLSAEIVSLANDENGDDEEKEDRCKELGREIRSIGGCQDTMAAQFRRIAKCVRQKATEMYAAADSVAERDALMHIRQTSAAALRNRMPHEGK